MKGQQAPNFRAWWVLRETSVFQPVLWQGGGGAAARTGRGKPPPIIPAGLFRPGTMQLPKPHLTRGLLLALGKPQSPQTHCWRARARLTGINPYAHLSTPPGPQTSCCLSGEGSLSKKLVTGAGRQAGAGPGTRDSFQVDPCPVLPWSLLCPWWALYGQHQSQWGRDPVQERGGLPLSGHLLPLQGIWAGSYLTRSPPP